ncbi:AUGMIN subunit 8-like isoform X1 [Olea europaea var. sylvestris]|uniref:AUGMIN subunit 8-like isoform X1 n=1 Tax=Olea europaea var. sylvestris TaxID=158386 RepID=UPI000C1CF16A|nr:AUGMIN subunit 8-like isoform X1 [Olea europaea var. sylvestris]XP_022845054.1 AUGMIN subunit 8-like isoform X1 [Olea europaea var. sylvestris]XP_022845062.1 AUGMIN subunit 8-like isoform X1 [Olea europaea var. sylvestris]
MDVCESRIVLQKHSTVDTARTPLVNADNKNGTTRQSQTREVCSRYRSPTPSAASCPRRCPSPNATRTSMSSIVSATKRSASAGRKRPTTPSPRSPHASTPVQDTTAEMLLASKKIIGNKLPESLWPSTMRSLSVSFQSDTFSPPISKREKPASHGLSDRTMKSSVNVVQKQGKTPPASRKPTPERKRSPVKGNNSTDHSENSRPIDALHTGLVDQHRWPSRTGGKVSSKALKRNSDLTDKTNRTSLSHSRADSPSLRRLSLVGMGKPLSETSALLTRVSRDDTSEKTMLGGCSVVDNSLLKEKIVSSISLNRETFRNSAVRHQSLPTPGSRPASPSLSRVSPSGAKAVYPSSRGPSPARVRPSSPSRQAQSLTSVLSFIVDIKRGKKAVNHIEDVHHMRLLYNRLLQWRYANARANSALHSQKIKAEKLLYNVWRATVDQWKSVIGKRIDLQQLRHKLKLYTVFNNQLACLDEWDFIERDHTNVLSWAIQDLQASTLCLPVTEGAKGDIEAIKAAVCSAIDVIHVMGSSIRSIYLQVEGMNSAVSDLAVVASQGRAMLDECESLLAYTAAIQQAEEHSRRTQLIQLRPA